MPFNQLEMSCREAACRWRQQSLGVDLTKLWGPLSEVIRKGIVGVIGVLHIQVGMFEKRCCAHRSTALAQMLQKYRNLEHTLFSVTHATVTCLGFLFFYCLRFWGCELLPRRRKHVSPAALFYGQPVREHASNLQAAQYRDFGTSPQNNELTSLF